ncbi:hypothetical protein ABVT39_004758 [Epinephelus coioides]
MTSELFIVSLVVLLLVLMVLLILCWILRHNRSRNFAELQISAGQPARILTIRTKPDHALQLLDQLLERVFLQVEPGPVSEEELGEEPMAEPVEEPGGEHRSDSDPEDPDPEVSASSLPRKAVNVLQNKLWKWISVTVPPAAASPPSPVGQDQTDNLCPQQSDASQHAPLSSQGASCSASWEEEQHNESQL